MCSTPQKIISDPVLNNGQNFSPIIVSDSPVSKTPQRGNLTGNPRVVRDAAADLFNRIQEWNRQHLRGVKILNNIVALKINSVSDSGDATGEPYPEGLQEQCDMLDEACCIMDCVVGALKGIVQQLNALVELERIQKAAATPLFLTWPTDKFGEVCGEITSAYALELNVKYCIQENVAHCKTKSDLMLHSAAWAHQPYINSDIKLALEGLLCETGHRAMKS